MGILHLHNGNCWLRHCVSNYEGSSLHCDLPCVVQGQAHRSKLRAKPRHPPDAPGMQRLSSPGSIQQRVHVDAMELGFFWVRRMLLAAPVRRSAESYHRNWPRDVRVLAILTVVLFQCRHWSLAALLQFHRLQVVLS